MDFAGYLMFEVMWKRKCVKISCSKNVKEKMNEDYFYQTWGTGLFDRFIDRERLERSLCPCRPDSKMGREGFLCFSIGELSLIHIDAADDLLCVDLGGRRIIKKKKKKKPDSTRKSKNNSKIKVGRERGIEW